MDQDKAAEPWNDYAPSAPPPAGAPESGPWNDYQQPTSSFGNIASNAAAGAPILGAAGTLASDLEDRTAAALHAFGQTMDEEGQREQFGLSEDSKNWLRKKGYFPSDDSSLLTKPIQGFTEAFMVSAFKALDAAWRAPGAVYHATEEAEVAAGVPRDIAALPQAFAGSPGSLHIAEPPPSVKTTPIRPIEGSPNPGLLRSEAAKTGVPEIDSVLGMVKHVIDNPVIDDSHEVPNSWGGSVPIDNPVTYRDKDFPKTLTVPRLSDPTKTVTFDTAEPASIHENTEEAAITLLQKGGVSRDASLRAAYWGWGNPAEHAWYRTHDMDPEVVEAALKPYLDKIAARKADPKNIPKDLFLETYPNGDPLEDVAGEIEKPTPEEVARAQKIIQDNTGPRITGGTADKPDLRIAKDLGVIGPERPSINEGTPEEAARNAIQPITAYHGSPYSFDAFDMGKIGTGEGAQSYGHGLYFAENPAVALDYQKNLAGNKEQGRTIFRSAGVNGEPYNADDPAHVAAGYAYQAGSKEAGAKMLQEEMAFTPKGRGPILNQALAILKSEEGPPKFDPDFDRGIMYQVRIHADRDHFLDWDKPLSEQSERVKDVLRTIIKDDKYDWSKSGEQFIRDNGTGDFAQKLVSDKLREAGIPGIKYLDQGSRRTPQEIKDEIAGIERDVRGARQNPVTGARIADLEAELKANTGGSTHNYVIFDHNDVEITHRNGEPVKPPAPPIPEPQPKTPPVPPVADGWQARFDHFVGRLDKPEDVQKLIHDAATENNNFPEARRGTVPMMQIQDIADAMGVSPEEVDARKIGQILPTDQHFRFAMQAAFTAVDNVKAAARDVLANPIDEAALIKFQEHIMRRDMMVEQIIGLRAQWGRLGNVMQEFMKNVKDGPGLDKFMATSCPL